MEGITIKRLRTLANISQSGTSKWSYIFPSEVILNSMERKSAQDPRAVEQLNNDQGILDDIPAAVIMSKHFI